VKKQIPSIKMNYSWLLESSLIFVVSIFLSPF
jgi:hypothetical protein